MANNTPKLFKSTALFVLTTLCMHSATAGVVRDDIDYQQFRDFAENKGKFAVGASNIEIKDKDGKSLGVILNGVPMLDFSAVRWLLGTNTLISPQYVVSVAHNNPDTKECNFTIDCSNPSKEPPEKVTDRHYMVAFGYSDNNPDSGQYFYATVDKNNNPKFLGSRAFLSGTNQSTIYEDYQAPRLNKLVTEVAPTQVATLGTSLADYINKYSVFVRVGSGNQRTLSKEGTTQTTVPCVDDQYCTIISGAYGFLTGGEIVLNDFRHNVLLSWGEQEKKDAQGNAVNHIYTKPFINMGESGDSGSPVFGFNKETKQWELIALYAGRFFAPNFVQPYMITVKPEFNQNEIDKDSITILTNIGQTLDWTGDNNGQSMLGNTNVSLTKTAVVDSVASEGLRGLRTDLNDGKTVYFTGEKGTLNLKSDINQGAGALYFDTDFTVKGENENITWLGAGISVAKDKTVTWQIKNPENDRLSKIGEGTLLVNGTGDNKGDISVGDGTVILNQKDGKAFNKVGIVSGRPVVKLENNKQVNPNDIYFGYRGGRLDLNGNHLSFDYIQNVDSGAMIVNHNPNQSATITLKTDATDKYKSAFNGVFGETNKDFFGNPLQDKNYHNGVLNVIYSPDSPKSDKTFLLSGGTNLNGDLTVKKGNLLLSGRPTPHAYDHLNNTEPFQDDGWIDRTFTAKNFIVNNDGKLTVGRNVSELNGNVTLKDKATGEIGYMNNQTSVCVRSDYFGTTDCQAKNYDDTVLKTIPITKVTGDMTLNNESQLTFGKAHLLGKVIADDKTALTLGKDSQWTMTGDSTTGDLNLQDGSKIHLNANYDKATTALYNVLTVGGKLTGNGKFNYLTNLAEQQGDKVIVKGIASGTHTLNVKDTGKEPFSPKDLVLLDLQNTNQTNENLTVKLTNAQNGKETVDLGAWRYELAQVGNQFVLMDKRHKNALSKYTNQALSAKYAQLNNAFSVTNGITAHLWNAPKYKGIWATVEKDDRTVTSPLFRNYDSEHTLTQLGIDETVDVRQGQLLVGTALSYGKGVQTFDDGKGESELLIGSAYGKWTSPKNAFVSFDLGFGQGTQQLTLTDKVKAKHTFAHLGLGVGKTWQAGNFTATPSLTVRQYHFGGDRYAMDGANIAYDKANILSYQPSIGLGYQFNTQSGLTLRPYLASTYTHTDDKAKVQVNTHQFVVPFANTWQHKVGLEAQKGKLYGQLYVSQEQGDHIKDGQKIGLSVGYGW